MLFTLPHAIAKVVSYTGGGSIPIAIIPLPEVEYRVSNCSANPHGRA